jgi:hypothetical protein
VKEWIKKTLALIGFLAIGYLVYLALMNITSRH